MRNLAGEDILKGLLAVSDRTFMARHAEPTDDSSSPWSSSRFFWFDAAKFSLFLYFALYISSIASMYFHISRVEPGDEKPTPGHVKGKSCPEDELWQSRSYLSWVSVSWLNPMMARLGHSWDGAMSKCHPDELPPVSSSEWQAALQCERFQTLWEEEVHENGESASIMRVLCKLWGYRQLLWLHTCVSVRVVIGNLYRVYLIQASVSYFLSLRAEVHGKNGNFPDMTQPILLSILAFSVQPLLSAVLSSFEANFSMQFDQSIAGVAVAVFKKTQRLPASVLSQGSQGRALGKEAKPNAMMVIDHDVFGNFSGLAVQVSLAINASLTAVVLLVLLAVKLRLAMLFCFAVVIPAFLTLMKLTGAMESNMMHLQEVRDHRVSFLREVLKGIRTCKIYTWESAVEEEISTIRKKELQLLGTYFRLTSHLDVLFGLFPRFMTCAGVWGFLRTYGGSDIALIFGCLQILALLRTESVAVSAGIQRIVAVRTSVMRVESFLKQEETPVLPGAAIPEWVEVTSAKQRSGHQPILKIQGSYFCDRGNTSLALHSLDVEVQRGELVAVVGGVGSGKSTLLEAALGELHPVSQKTAFLSRPEVCGYSAQVPHLAEGTLRDNILFGQPYDEARYRKVVAAAGLLPDLKFLPGRDEAFIGAGGISLSGGQRARVSLARTAYNLNAELVLLDDPFSSLDAPTAMWILEEMICGPLLKDRACLVALQPEMERLRKFDKVYVMSEGRIVAAGKPDEVADAEEFRQLLRSSVLEDGLEVMPIGAKTVEEQRAAAAAPEPELFASLRSSEVEARPTWEMTKKCIGFGKWRNMLGSVIMFAVVLLIFLFSDIALANATNALTLDPRADTGPYFQAYLFWIFLSILGVYLGWICGACFSLCLSRIIHDRVVQQLLHAPIDRFFDKHPVGRIMSCLTMDMTEIDLSLYLKAATGIVVLLETLVPLAYVNFIMPRYMSLVAIPFCCIVSVLHFQYQNTGVSLRRCFKKCSSLLQSHLSDVMTNTVVVRGFGEHHRLAAQYARSVDDRLKIQLTGERLMKRWLCNRVNYMWTFYNSMTYIIALYSVSWLGPGYLGIALTNLLLIQSMLEPSMELVAGALFEMISLARVHEYTLVVQEKAFYTPEDAKLRSYSARFEASPPLTFREAKGEIEVLANGEVFLNSSPDGRSLMLLGKKENNSNPHLGGFQQLCGTCDELKEIPSLHHLVAVNDACGNARDIAKELCRCARTSTTVLVQFRSTWLSDGVRLDVQDLTAGYAEVPQDILKGVTFSVEPRKKVAVVGTTGCGKSSLLLALLRIIEPRGGKILINSVDTRQIGLATLRGSLGLVPQDPMLFTGTLRFNLDPFNVYTDQRIRSAIQLAQLDACLKKLPGGLDHAVSEEGGNLSFGQRQLLCLIRMVLRQPAVLLLDEATSAIDPATQEAVQDTVSKAFSTSTILAVAHRLETIMEFDQVLVLEEGAVQVVAAKSVGIFKHMLESG